jgi:hypothetical protein
MGITIDEILESLDGEPEDPLSVALCTMYLDNCDRPYKLRATGKKIARENLSDNDRKILRVVYLDCLKLLGG